MTPTPPMTTPNVISDPNDMLLALWRAGRRTQAMEMEAVTRKSNPKIPIISLWCEEQLERYIGQHPSVLEMKSVARKLALVDDPVLIIGPTGTGKELLARALHGPRSGAFVAINCTALPSELLESELFGHRKGSFTGAVEDRPGKIKSAWNGTLFLDEIGDMPIDMQAKLLRVLQEKEFTALGDDGKVEKMNCRIVAATNKDVSTLLGNIHFRDDLYYRLSTFVLRTLPLIDRYEDIAEIVDSLGGTGLYTEFEKWKLDKVQTAHIDAWEMERDKHSQEHWKGMTLYGLRADYTREQHCHHDFFDLKGNVRTLQSQIRRYQVLGVTR